MIFNDDSSDSSNAELPMEQLPANLENLERIPSPQSANHECTASSVHGLEPIGVNQSSLSVSGVYCLYLRMFVISFFSVFFTMYIPKLIKSKKV